MKENIKNAFECVKQVHKETSFLLKDFSEALGSCRFINIISGNSIGTTYVSKDINSPSYWTPRYITLCFKPEEQQPNFPLMFVTVCYYDINESPNAIEPLLILGMADGMDDPSKRGWEFWWVYSAYFNENNTTEYFMDKEYKNPLMEKPSPNGKIVYFKHKNPNNNWRWFKEGALFAVSLLDVKDYATIKEYAKKLADLWVDVYDNK